MPQNDNATQPKPLQPRTTAPVDDLRAQLQTATAAAVTGRITWSAAIDAITRAWDRYAEAQAHREETNG